MDNDKRRSFPLTGPASNPRFRYSAGTHEYAIVCFDFVVFEKNLKNVIFGSK